MIAFQYSAVSLSLPLNINLLTFEPWKDKSILVRFEHILAEGEDSEYSKPVTFNLKDVFHNLKIDELRETTLAGNQWLSDAVRLNFTGGSIERSNRRQKSTNEFMNIDDDIVLEEEIVIKPFISENQYRKTPYRRAERNEEMSNGEYKITLKPMEIRTFVMKLEQRP